MGIENINSLKPMLGFDQFTNSSEHMPLVHNETGELLGQAAVFFDRSGKGYAEIRIDSEAMEKLGITLSISKTNVGVGIDATALVAENKKGEEKSDGQSQS
jgi:hypothetical protein